MGSLDADRVRELCSDRNCRIVLAVFAEHGRTLTVTDLTRAIVKHELQQSITEVDGEAVREVERDLEDEQLPKLAEVGLVTYDEERGRVEPGPQFDDVRSEVERIVGSDSELDTPVEI